MGKRNEWTTKEVRYLQQHYGFIPVSRLAATLGRTEEAVRNYACNLGIKSPLRRRKPENFELIQKMIYDGAHPTEIALAIGTSTKAVYNRVRNGLCYDRMDYRTLLANRRRKGRMDYIRKKRPAERGDADNRGS